MKIESKKLTVFFALLLCGLGMAGCNTVEGAGQDIENAGESVQDTARSNK